jgi:hypothetical protein
MEFDLERQFPPHDRSIFRKNIGRVLLYDENDPYLEVWNSCLKFKSGREKFRQLRNIEKKKEIENRVSEIIRINFSFRYLIFGKDEELMGTKGIESSLIGSVAGCTLCKPSRDWMGFLSPVGKIRDGKLWQCQHLKSPPINEKQKNSITDAIKRTLEWINSKNGKAG